MLEVLEALHSFPAEELHRHGLVVRIHLPGRLGAQETS